MLSLQCVQAVWIEFSVGNSFGIFKNFRQVDGGLKMLRLVWEDQKYLKRTELLAVILVVFVLGHEDH